MEMAQERSKLFASSFILKVVAILTMTLDHIGVLMIENNLNVDLAFTFRCLGRLALPLFCFMIVEGVLHTKSFKKYAIRLGIAAILISLGLILIEYLPIFGEFSMRNEGNIFIDLLLGATAVYCLTNKKVWVKCLAILPLAYAIGSSFAASFECVNCGREVWIIPFFLRTQANFYGVILILSFYLAHVLGNIYISQSSGGIYKNTTYEQSAKNIIAVVLLTLINLLFYFSSTIIDASIFNYMDMDLQLVSIFAGILILFYNGKRGYNAYWFKYGCYLYYAIHMVIVYGLFAILF